MESAFNHYSVMKEEAVAALNVKPDGIYVDGTLGGAGHSEEIAKKLDKGLLIGIDRDEDAIKASKERLLPYKEKVKIVRDNYENVKRVLSDLNVAKVDGILLDLGVSSFQLDTEERGFTYRSEDAPLDMRMDRRDGTSAKDIINSYSEEELKRILFEYGEERFAGNIARNIVKFRTENKEIETAGELNNIIRKSIPKKYQAEGHPSKRTYQAIRIELNRELTVLENSIDEMAELLNPGGRLVIITFHSLEDRIVKLHFKKLFDPCICPKNFPVCVCGRKSKGKMITRKPILPKDDEIEENKRSKSAKMRIFERT